MLHRLLFTLLKKRQQKYHIFLSRKVGLTLIPVIFGPKNSQFLMSSNQPNSIQVFNLYLLSIYSLKIAV